MSCRVPAVRALTRSPVGHPAGLWLSRLRRVPEFPGVACSGAGSTQHLPAPGRPLAPLCKAGSRPPPAVGHWSRPPKRHTAQG